MVTLADVDAQMLSSLTHKSTLPSLTNLLINQNSLCSILTSEQIALIPSNSSTPIYIHEGLLTSVSPALRAACQGKWTESVSKVYRFFRLGDDNDNSHGDHVDGSVNTDAVSSELLICFVSWAYTGDYSTEMIGVSSFVEQTVVPPPAKGKKKPADTVPLWGNFGSPEPGLEPEPADTPEIPSNSSSSSPNTTLTPLILHVQLYVLATIYLIPTLQALTKKKIATYLQKIQTSRSKASYTPAIFDLIEYASSYLEEEDSLLKWLATYASWNLASLREDKGRLDGLLGDEKFMGLLIGQVLPSKVDPFFGTP